MADNKELIEARHGLVQYIGALITRISYRGADARQVVCAILLEEALKLVTVNNNIEMFSSKPILRATVAVLNQRINDYETLLHEAPVDMRQSIMKQRDNLEQVKTKLSDFVSKITKEA